MFLVIDRQATRPGITTGGDEFKEDTQYRPIAVTGGTYSEKAFREWVNKTWDAPIDAPISELVKACYQGGWRVLQLMPLVP